MSIRGLISFDIQKEERYYHILIPNGAPYQEARDVLNEILATLDAQEKADKEQAAPEASCDIAA